MKKIFSAIISSPLKGRLGGLLLALLATTTLWAYDFQAGDLYYEIIDDQSVAVSHQILNDEWNYHELTHTNIPTAVTYQGVTYTVTEIGEWAFAGCSTLASVTLPNTIKRIGDVAFADCSSLTSIVIPEGVTYIGEGSFQGCISLTDISVPSTITHIGSSYSFLYTPWLDNQPDGVIYIGKVLYKYKGEMPANTSISVKEGTTSICMWAFNDYANLISITAPNTLVHIGEFALHGTAWLENQPEGFVYLNKVLYTFKDTWTGDEYVIPNIVEIQEGTLGIAERALEYGEMDSVRIPNTVKVIGDGAFRYCDYLRALDIPNSVTYLGEYSCYDCPRLETVTIGSGLKEVGENAFDDCIALHTVTFEEGATFVADAMFGGCKALTTINLPNTIRYIGAGAFNDCENLQLTSLPNQITRIENFTFQGCNSITNITLNDNITYIGERAFGYTGISEIRLPNTLKTIEREAFAGCQNLREITIPENVEKITGDLFNGCPLETVTWNAINCNNLGFNDDDGHHIESPFESRGDYIHTFTFGDKVKHIPAGLCRYLRQVQEITLPNSVESIGNNAFFGCSNLTTITISENVKRIGHNVFEYCPIENVLWNAKNYVVQPDDDGAIYFLFGYDNNITSFVIGQHVEEFPIEMLYIMTSLNHIAVESGNTRYDSRSNCNAIIETATNTLLRGCNTTIIPQGVVVIGDNALSECRNIRSIEIPNTLTTIGSNAFSGCIALESITIPSSIQVIEQGAFSACPSIVSIKVDDQNPIFDSRNNCNAIIETATNVLLHGCQKTVIPEGVIGIGGGAFEDCAYLSAINIPSTVKTIGLGAFYDCSSLEYVEIGTGVETIEAYAFGDCASLAYVNIPNNVTSVGEYAFVGCTSLMHATIGAGVDTIADGVFGGCDAMTHLVIGKNVKHIGTLAFAYCESLDTIYCYAEVPPTTGEECFDYVQASVLFVPCSALEAYQEHETWKNVAIRIECIGSEQVNTDDIEVSATNTTVTITWPTEENADTYTIIINKGDETFCTLTFNADGQLLNITFAPARNGNNRVVQYATQTANGLRFTVTGLNEGTHYNYDITAKDKEENTLQSYSGEFTTQSYVPSSVENTDTQSQQSNTQKLLRNGQLIILRDGKTYNVMGQEL